ncbi:39S RIBOSOMAL PROTEIN L18 MITOCHONDRIAL [Salix koriyanagi]|uniref:39S RIBOSOMAL PROTEIN L18 MITOCHONDRIAL n=1 Tax=Salix koriyanagi TaxID=2511006 RepID=A0A9Q1A4G4_9ROSI|nr:39S RIBOSOMAL PROTEIN L18 MITOCHONDRIAL [Salix koriyanagi]
MFSFIVLLFRSYSEFFHSSSVDQKISRKFIQAKVMHRGTSKVISVATTNAKDLRHDLPSLTDHNACRIVGKLIAERSKEVDVYAMSYEPRKDERIEGFVVVNDVGI